MQYGFIGLGNMATAIIRGMLRSPSYAPQDILGFDPYAPSGADFAARTGIGLCASLADLAEADVLVLAVKPQVLAGVMADLRTLDLSRKLCISIAAGRTLTALREGLGKGCAIVRVMPNINAKVGAATSAFAANEHCGDTQKTIARDIFATIGSIMELAEEQFAVFTAIAGCSPAFTYMYIDALARAAVRRGLPKAKALAIAASAVCGSATMVLESQEHPFALIDQVSSPGGTTIEGVCALQEYGFESAVHKAVEATIIKDSKL